MTAASTSAWLGFLASPAAPKNTLSPLALEGYLTGVVVAPELIPPSRWIAALWGDEEPVFDSDADLRAVFGTLMTRYDSLSSDIDNGAFVPACDIDERLDEAAQQIPRAILVLHKIAKLRAARSPRKAEPKRQTKIGRNDPCPCRSGKKYKRCCGAD